MTKRLTPPKTKRGTTQRTTKTETAEENGTTRTRG